MAHIHELYDFVVSVFIVHKDKVLLIYHKRYNEWLPIGGHIELDEDPEMALYREIKEESGLKVRLLASKPAIAHKGVKPILTPSYVDTHRITKTHKHTAFVYFGTAGSDKVRLHEREHREFKWLSAKELAEPRYKLTRSIRFYCAQALKAAKKKKLFIISGVFYFALFFLAPLQAVEIEYAKVFDVTGSAKFVGLKSGSWKPLSQNLVLRSGTRIKTGSGSRVQIKMNRDYSSVIQVNSNSYLKLRNEPPNKITIEKGDLYVIREADPETKTSAEQDVLQISTKDLLVEIKQGGCMVSVTDRGTWLKVFQEKVEAAHVLADRTKTKTWTVYEGTALHAKSLESQTSLTRMQYEDYNTWQVWIRSWYDRKDKISAEKLRKDLAI